MSSAKYSVHYNRADQNAQLVSRTIQSVLISKNLRLPKRGYVLRMARGRLIVTPVTGNSKQNADDSQQRPRSP